MTREYPAEYSFGKERFYPVNNEKNNALYQSYARLAEGETNVFFAGRLGAYKYFDMDKTIANALDLSEKLLSK